MSLALRDRLSDLSNVQLKDELKKFNSKQSGVKGQLVERLAFLIEREQSTRDPSLGKKYQISHHNTIKDHFNRFDLDFEFRFCH